MGGVTSFDAGRGCPFQCSFCTIINVQGRKSRFRTPDDVEAIVRANLAQGVRAFFITDDNLARNKNWEPIFDRLIEVRADTGVNFSIVIQVDTLCHRIPNFIEKAAKAGVRRVFLGLENINPDNLIAAKKKQNRIAEYRTMLLAWKAVGCFTYAGYILGFPNDTPDSIIRDIEIIQRELPLDLLEFFCLTPLPGSEDHQKLLKAGIPMDPDMNKYDLEHVTTAHPKMSKAEWEGVYRQAWEVYYTPEHMETIMRRAYATGISPGKMMFLLIWFYGCVTIEKIHPLEGGYLRRKVRRDRRPGLPIENPFVFYPKYAAELVAKHVKIAGIVWRMSRTRRAIKRDPKARLYRDLALTPVADADLETLEMFQQTQSSARRRRQGEAARRGGRLTGIKPPRKHGSAHRHRRLLGRRRGSLLPHDLRGGRAFSRAPCASGSLHAHALACRICGVSRTRRLAGCGRADACVGREARAHRGRFSHLPRQHDPPRLFRSRAALAASLPAHRGSHRRGSGTARLSARRRRRHALAR